MSERHKLLAKQIRKYLPESFQHLPELDRFFSAINDSYSGFERDHELWTHAFDLSEREYHDVNNHLSDELKLKQISLQKLKKALQQIDESSYLSMNLEGDELLNVVDYLNEQISKRKAVEADLSKSAQLLSTLVSNLDSGILMEDADRHILYINEMFCNMFNIPASPEQLLGADCSSAAEQSKHLFKSPDRFVSRISHVLKQRKLVRSDELELVNGRFFERSYIPIFINGVYQGHLWKYNDITERKQNEIKLKESQDELQRLSLVASANMNGVLLTDATGRIFWSNQGYLNQTGYTSEELVGKRPIDVAKGRETDRKQLQQMIRAYAQGLPFEIEVAYYRKDKSYFWARVKGQPNLDKAGKVVQYFSIIEDITEVREREKQMERLSLVASANSKGVFFMDDDLSLGWVNAAYEHMTGYTQSQLLGQTPAKLFDLNEVAPEILQEMRSKDACMEDFTVEFMHPRKSGTRFWARLNVQFIKDEKGLLLQRFGVIEDITRERDAAELLRHNEEKYRNIIANMNLGLLEVDEHDVIQYVNQSFTGLCGYSADELIGSKATDLFLSGENVDLIASKNNLRKSGKSDAYELRVRNNRGEVKYWLVSGAPRVNDKGEVIGSIGIHLDITNQKQQEMELKEARIKAEDSARAKETFLANMSHEIRTPLNAIIGMLRELSKETLTGKQQAYLNNADTASRHLLSIINNVLDMSKIEAGEFKLDNRHFSLRDLMNEVVTIISPAAEEKLLELKMKVADNLAPAFIGDASRVRQLLINIAGNAIKFTEKGGVSIECTVVESNLASQKLKITIADTGIGMDKQYLQNLFRKFSQEDGFITRKYGGTGLGMSISYELVQLMGGDIRVESEKGRGTLVHIIVNFPKGDVQQIESATPDSDFNELRGVKVLLAEDNEMNRLVAMNTLSYYGLETVEVANGREAVELIQQQTFDVLLMDLHMPEMDGLEATRIIRQRLGMDIPVIALTANAFKKEIDQCLKSGMNDYVTKPFEEIVLMQAIRRNLPRKRNAGTAPLYDLSKLIELSRGNDAFVKKMVNLFVEQTRLSLEQFKEAISQSNHERIKEVAHRIKPSIDNMGIVSLKNVIRVVEQEAADGQPFTMLLPKIMQVETVLKQVLEKLEAENR